MCMYGTCRRCTCDFLYTLTLYVRLQPWRGRRVALLEFALPLLQVHSLRYIACNIT